jgi:signal transduction histidine kinase
MGNIELQVNLLLSFVNDLLDLARIDEGFFNLEKAEFSFHKVMHETYLMFKRHADI